jgi:DNA-binding NarL/FixJ family response regulator
MSADAVSVQHHRDSLRRGDTAFWGEPRKRTLVLQGQVWVMESLKVRSQGIRDMLTQERFRCGLVEDSRAAVGLLSRHFVVAQEVPQLLICNARMLGDAGLAALARLCVNGPPLPTIVFSVYSTPRLREQMARLYGVWVFDQDFGLEDLRAAALSLTGVRQGR